MRNKPKPRILRYFKGGVEGIISNKIFDIIVASEVIEYVNNPSILLQLKSKFQYQMIFLNNVNRQFTQKRRNSTI